jgi:tryptophan halogenase
MTVAVVGRDAALWIAAAAIQRSLGSTGVKVRAIELPSLLRPVDVYSAMPAIQGLHRQIGLNEDLVVAAVSAVPLVAQRYSNWLGAAPPFMLGYDDPPPPGSDIGFVHYWVKGRQGGLRVPLEDFSLAVSAAKHGRLPLAEDQPPELSATYGYNLAAEPYSWLLKSYAERLGVESEAATIRKVETEADRIASVELSSGSRIDADLFVDASGAGGALIAQLPGSELESWDELLPCDGVIVASGAPISPPPLYSQVSAFRGGWIGVFPLQDRTAVLATYSSAHISHAELLEMIPLLARVQLSGEGVASEIRRGLRRCSWIGNCVAVGEAAIALDPLDSFGLYTTHVCISHLMALFPVTADHFPEAELYNRTIALAGENLRDFQGAHYRLNRRFDEPFWDHCRDMPLPESLERKIEVFSRTAHVPLYDEEPFEEQNWAALFAGGGIMPEGYDPRVDMAPDEALIERVQQRLRAIAAVVPKMLPASEFVNRARERLEVAR